jgi:hypothetical protein
MKHYACNNMQLNAVKKDNTCNKGTDKQCTHQLTTVQLDVVSVNNDEMFPQKFHTLHNSSTSPLMFTGVTT